MKFAVAKKAICNKKKQLYKKKRQENNVTIYL